MGVYVEEGYAVHPADGKSTLEHLKKELLREAEHYVALVGCLSEDGEIEE